jgi:alpha-tubulin suppressor-like RCC1 family protein
MAASIPFLLQMDSSWPSLLQLGTGPTMSRYSCPQQISILPSLKLEVISVACGRQHTLSLTNNGVSDQFLILGLTT